MTRMADDGDNVKAAKRQGFCRWFRFNLRTLLVVLTLVGIGLGIQVNRASRQRRAVAAIEELHGYILYDYEIEPKGGDYNRLPDPRPPGPVWLRRVVGLDYFAKARVEGLRGRQVNELHGLEALVVDTKAIANEGEQISRLTNLQTLALYGAPIDEASLQCLFGMKHLKRLVINGNSVSEDGIEQLRQALPNCDIEL